MGSVPDVERSVAADDVGRDGERSEDWKASLGEVVKFLQRIPNVEIRSKRDSLAKPVRYVGMHRPLDSVLKNHGVHAAVIRLKDSLEISVAPVTEQDNEPGNQSTGRDVTA